MQTGHVVLLLVAIQGSMSWLPKMPGFDLSLPTILLLLDTSLVGGDHSSSQLGSVSPPHLP